MIIAMASYGSRGDVESSAAVGRELLRRGHQVRMAVPPNLVSLAESAGISPLPYGLDSLKDLDAYRNLWTSLASDVRQLRQLRALWREASNLDAQCRRDATQVLMSISDGADLLVTGLAFEEQAADIAEYYGIPLTTLDFFPVRANGSFSPTLPSPLLKSAMIAHEWVTWFATKNPRTRDVANSAFVRPLDRFPTGWSIGNLF